MVDDKQRQEPEGGSPILRDFALFGLIVADLMGYTGAGIALGWGLWKKLGAPSWVLLLTTGAGLVVAMVRVYQRSRS
jgi:hypothetical protein